MDRFDFLKHFVGLFKGRKLIKDIPFSLYGPPRSKVERLFQGIANEEFKSDEEAAAKIYGTSSSNPAYLRLKSRLEKKLIQQIFLIDFETPPFPPKSKEYYNSFTTAVAIRIIMGLGYNLLTYPIIKKEIKKNKKNRFTEVGLLHSISWQILQNDYSQQNKKEQRDNSGTNASPLFFIEALKTELSIEAHHGLIISNLLKGGISNDKEIQDSYNSLLELTSAVNSIALLSIARLYYALAAANIHFKNYIEAIKNCEIGIKLLSNSTVPSINILYLLKAQCFLHLNEFDKAQRAIAEAEEKRVRADVNWLAVSELKFITNARSCSFDRLTDIYESTITNPKFRMRTALTKESWRQYGIMLLFLIKLGKIPPSESLERVKPKLRLAKLMNEMPEYAKDKTGQNLAIRILYVLNLLVAKKFDQFETELPALQSYINRYKRAYPELLRSDLLVRMLSNIPKVRYDAKHADWRARDLLPKMQVPPESLPIKITEMEIIPYEKIWQFVVEFLGTIRNRMPRA